MINDKQILCLFTIAVFTNEGHVGETVSNSILTMRVILILLE